MLNRIKNAFAPLHVEFQRAKETGLAKSEAYSVAAQRKEETGLDLINAGKFEKGAKALDEAAALKRQAGLYKQAHTTSRIAARTWEEIGKSKRDLNAFEKAAKSWDGAGDPAKAKEYHLELAKMYQEKADQGVYSIANLHNAADHLNAAGKFKEAADAYFKAATAYVESPFYNPMDRDDEDFVAKLYLQAGEAYVKAGTDNNVTAIKAYQNAFKHIHLYNRDRLERDLKRPLAAAQNNASFAFDTFQNTRKSLRHNKNLNDTQRTAAALEAYKLDNNAFVALQEYQKAAKIALQHL